MDCFISYHIIKYCIVSNHFSKETWKYKITIWCHLVVRHCYSLGFFEHNKKLIMKKNCRCIINFGTTCLMSNQNKKVHMQSIGVSPQNTDYTWQQEIKKCQMLDKMSNKTACSKIRQFFFFFSSIIKTKTMWEPKHWLISILLRHN